MKSLIVAICLSVVSFSNAFAQKIGTVNSQEILYSMPETKAMQGKLQARQTELSKQLEGMYKTYEGKAVELKKNSTGMMDAIYESKVQELSDLEKRIQKFEETAQSEVSKLEQTLTAPILDKAKKTIDEVAKENGYTHVFDVANGSLLVFPDANDITGKVKSKLGIVETAAPAGGK